MADNSHLIVGRVRITGARTAAVDPTKLEAKYAKQVARSALAFNEITDMLNRQIETAIANGRRTLVVGLPTYASAQGYVFKGNELHQHIAEVFGHDYNLLFEIADGDNGRYGRKLTVSWPKVEKQLRVDPRSAFQPV